MHDDGVRSGLKPAGVRRGWVRSKTRVLLLVGGAVVVLFAAGVVWRVVRPTTEDQVIRDLPVYPGARAAGFPATDIEQWRRLGSGFGEPIVLSYVLPRGTSRDEVLRYYGTHMPRSFSRDGPACWARGDARVLLVVSRAAAPALDIGVATEDAECPSG